MNELYLYPIKTVRKLKVTSALDFVLPLLLGGVILGLAVELRNLNSGLYVGLTWKEGLFLLAGGLVITIVSFLLLLYVLPLLLYKFEFMLFQVKDNMKRFAYVLALLAPLYAIGVLARILLDIFLPEHSVFKFIELLVPSVAELYGVAILFIALRDYFKLDNVRAVVVTALPWVLMLIYNAL